MMRFQIRHMFFAVSLFAMLMAVQRDSKAITFVYCVFLALVIPLYLHAAIQAVQKSVDDAQRATVLAATMLLAAFCAITVPGYMK